MIFRNKKAVLISLFLVSLSLISCSAMGRRNAAVETTANSIIISVDPRIELLAVVQLLSDYTVQGRPVLTHFDFPYKQEIAETFAPFSDHQAVTLFDEMSTKGFWYSHPPTAMLYHSNPPELNHELEFTDFVMMTAGGRESLDTFIEALRSFAIDTNFMGFYNAHRPMYKALTEDYIEVMQRNYVKDIEEYYGDSLHRYTIILAPLFHPGGFGPRLRLKGDLFEVYFLGGPKELKNGEPSFGNDDNIRYLCWHEFSHSFVNHHTEDNVDDFRPSVDILEASTKESMKDQMEYWDIHVSDWVSEHIVRGVTTRLAYKQFGASKGDEMAAFEISQGFPYVREVAASLEKYEQQRDIYPTLASYYPELIKTFKEIAAGK